MDEEEFKNKTLKLVGEQIPKHRAGAARQWREDLIFLAD